MGIPTATRVDANLGIDSEIGVNAESRRRNSKWTKNSASGPLASLVATLIWRSTSSFLATLAGQFFSLDQM